MRKNLIYAGMLLLGLTVATSCSNEDSLEQVLSNGTTIEAVIENATEARTSVNDSYQVLWTTGDAFNVFENGEKKATLTLSDGAETTSGKFTIDNEVEITENMVALFPASETLSYEFKTTYNSQETDAPMSATFADGKFTFSLLTAMVRVVITDVPQGTAMLTISSNDMNLTGEATLSNGALGLVANGGTKEVTVTIQNNTASTLTFDVPVPVQNYANGLNVKLTVGNDEVFNKTTNGFEAEKGKIYVFGTTVISDVDALMDALANGGDVTLTDDVTLIEAVTIAAGINVTIDLGGNTLTTSTTSGSDVPDDIIVKGTLVVKNGNVKTANTAFFANGGTLTLIDCQITTSSTYGAAAVMVSGAVGELNISGGSYAGQVTEDIYDRYVIGIIGGSTATINTTVSGGNGGVTVIGASTANLTGGSYSGVKACGLYVDGQSTVTYSGCQFSGVEGDVVVGNQNGGGTVNNTTYNAYTKIEQASTIDEVKSILSGGGNVTLASDIELNLTTGSFLTIDEGKDVTIDLGGNTLTTSTTSSSDVPDDITVKGTLVVKNGNVKTANTAFFANGGTLTLTDCDITTNSTYGAAAVMVSGAAGKLNISGGSYTGQRIENIHDRYVIGVIGGSSATINTTVSGGNGGVTVIGASTANLTGGSYSGVKACGLYVDGQSTVTYTDDCTFNGVEGYVVVGNQNGGGTVNGTEYTEYTRIQ